MFSIKILTLSSQWRTQHDTGITKYTVIKWLSPGKMGQNHVLADRMDLRGHTAYVCFSHTYDPQHHKEKYQPDSNWKVLGTKLMSTPHESQGHKIQCKAWETVTDQRTLRDLTTKWTMGSQIFSWGRKTKEYMQKIGHNLNWIYYLVNSPMHMLMS